MTYRHRWQTMSERFESLDWWTDTVRETGDERLAREEEERACISLIQSGMWVSGMQALPLNVGDDPRGYGGHRNAGDR